MTAGDIAQDRRGWFYRHNGTTLDCLSVLPGRPNRAPQGALVVLYSNGAATGLGDPTASRMASQILAKRYATA